MAVTISIEIELGWGVHDVGEYPHLSDDFESETLAADELGDLYTHPRGRPVLTYLEKTARGVLRG
ncbi:hypothetical protein [Halobacterium sp. CBA1126]|uniref:hypothetical protein n=1 Tax=Halobacterium sp. CBA1126 TaxID=2668074 RepID=UPI0012FC4BAD|nr:hypothetical protein [Halobacterium sp. CBA1126]MUV61355.1 hypothetical protein [Halobacterium sp. CBA1126]